MLDYARGSQEERDEQLLYTAATFAPNDTMIRELLELIKRRDSKSTAMLTLLERWVSTFDVWYSSKSSYEAISALDSVLQDTKTLLKEAKVE